MIETETKQKLARHFGLKHLDFADEHQIKNDETGESSMVDARFIWIVKAPYYSELTQKGRRDLLVAVVKTPEWRKGILLAPAPQQSRFNDEEYIGGDTLTALDLASDPVEDMLKCINLTSAHYPKYILTEQAHTFELCISTPIISADLVIHTGFAHEELRNKEIWSAVKSVIKTL